MENKLNCWVDLNTVQIPPLDKKGFQEDIIIRNKVKPVILKKPQTFHVVEQKEELYEDIYTGDEVTILLQDEEDEYDGEGATVLVNRKVVHEFYLRRQKTGEIFRIDKERFVIGKSIKADYVIKDNQTISRAHAAVCCVDGEYFLEDLQSANCTFVDGEPISGPVPLSDGMTFTLSSDEAFEFMVQ